MERLSRHTLALLASTATPSPRHLSTAGPLEMEDAAISKDTMDIASHCTRGDEASAREQAPRNQDSKPRRGRDDEGETSPRTQGNQPASKQASKDVKESGFSFFGCFPSHDEREGQGRLASEEKKREGIETGSERWRNIQLASPRYRYRQHQPNNQPNLAKSTTNYPPPLPSPTQHHGRSIHFVSPFLPPPRHPKKRDKS